MGQIDDVLHGQVLIVRLAGSGANAITRSMAVSLEEIAGRAGRSESVRVLLITGACGENFCAGSNIRELAELHSEGKGPGPLLEAEASAFQAIADLNIPTIAAIQGVTMGGGLELALCCDFIVAAEDTRISFPEIFLGVFPALGGTVRLQQRIGEGRARELLMLGRELDGKQACEWGLVTRAVPPADLNREARALADRLAAAPSGCHCPNQTIAAARARGLRASSDRCRAGGGDTAFGLAGSCGRLARFRSQREARLRLAFTYDSESGKMTSG